MTYVIKHMNTGLFIGCDEDHIIADDALQFNTYQEAKDYRNAALPALDGFTLVPNDPTRSNHINLASDNQRPENISD